MALDDSSSKTTLATSADSASLNQTAADVAPPVGQTPPQILAQDAAAGRRGAAWRLMYWIIENDPRAVVAVASLDDDRLAQHLLEFIAQGTWANKPFVIPRPLRSAYARTRLRTLFLPHAGMDAARAERVLLAGAHDQRPAIRENAIHILGIIGSSAATPVLIEALTDSVPAIRVQAAKALGRVRDPAAIPALLLALQTADEEMGSQVFSALRSIGRMAVPALIERCTSKSAWVRWHCVRALGEIGDTRALPALVTALCDTDHSVAWMSARGLVHFGKQSIVPILRMLMTVDMSSWIVEATSFVLRDLYTRNDTLKPYLEPVVQEMHSVAYHVATPLAAQKALYKLMEDDIVKA